MWSSPTELAAAGLALCLAAGCSSEHVAKVDPQVVAAYDKLEQAVSSKAGVRAAAEELSAALARWSSEGSLPKVLKGDVERLSREVDAFGETASALAATPLPLAQQPAWRALKARLDKRVRAAPQ